MRGNNHIATSISIAAIALLIVATTSPAEAYIDAGTGTYVLQMIAAFFVAGLIALRAFWGNIKQAVSRLGSRRSKE